MSASPVAGPEPKEAVDFSFRQMSRVRIVEQNDDGYKNDIENVAESPQQRIAVADNFGLLFVGAKNCFVSAKVKDIEALNTGGKEEETPVTRSVKVDLPSTPSHLAVNADETMLAVATFVSGKPHVYVFDVRSFADGVLNAKPFVEIRTMNPPGTLVLDLMWNPVMCSMLTAVFSNGSMALFMISGSDGSFKVDTATLPPGEKIKCVCWSPKGKQLVAGKEDGTLTQYKPDLKEAKTIPSPAGGDYTALSVSWISTYQFFVLYRNNGDPDSRPGLFLVQSSKSGETSYTDYNDITYSSGERRRSHFAMLHQPDWSLIFCCSANSLEVGVMANTDGNWIQWNLPDDGRAELPLVTRTERFPVGAAMCYSAEKVLKKDETNTHPFSMPILFLLSPDSLLCGFYTINSAPNAVRVTKPIAPRGPDKPRSGTISIPIEGFSSKLIASTPIKPTAQALTPPKPPQATPQMTLQTPEPPPVINLEEPVGPTKISNSKYQNAIREEILLFEQQMREFRERAGDLNARVSSKEAMEDLKKNSKEMDEFSKALVETTSSQTKEVRQLQKATYENMSWVEEAKSRQVRNNDSRYVQLLKGRALDPKSQKVLKNVESKFNYVDEQLNELNAKLDLEWNEHCSNSKSKSSSSASPSLTSKQMLFQSVLTNQNILESQRSAVAQLTKKITELKLKNLNSTWTPGTGAAKQDDEDDEFIKLAEAVKTSNSKSIKAMTPLKVKDEMTLNDSFSRSMRILSTSPIQGFSPEKESKLRQYLSERGTKKVTPVRAEVGTSRFLTDMPPKLHPVSASRSLVATLNQMAKRDDLSVKKFDLPKPDPPKPTGQSLAPAVAPSAPSKPSQSGGDSKIRGTSSTFSPVTLKPATGSGGPSFNLAGSKPAAPVVKLGTPEPAKPATTKTPLLPTPGTGPSTLGLAKPTSIHSSFSFTGKTEAKTPNTASVTTVASTTFFGGIASTTSSMFGGSSGSTTLTFGTPTSKQSAMPVVQETPKTTTTAPVKPPTTTAPATTTAAPTSSSSGIFGSLSTPASSSSGQSLFGGASPAPPSSGIFGGASKQTPPTTTAASLFGVGPATVFSNVTPKSDAPGIFGGSTATSTLFGGTTPASNTSATSSSILGGGVTTTTSSSAFGNVALSSGSSVFGQPKSSVASTTKSSSNVASSSGPLVFGQPKSTMASTAIGSVATESSVFGQQKVTAASTTGESSSIFGATVCSPSTTKSSGSSSIFGGTSTVGSGGSIFGGAPASTTASIGIFGGGVSSNSGGGFFSGLGSTPKPDAASKNVFGGSATKAQTPFGCTPASTASIFGGATPTAPTQSIFGSSTPTAAPSSPFGGSAPKTTSEVGSVFGSGNSVASQGFGVSQPSSQPSGGFGSPPTFGGAPSFGGSSPTKPGFGAAPAFGASPSFGSSPAFGAGSSSGTAGSVFGGATTSIAPTFGSMGAGSGSTFGGLASQGGAAGGNTFGSISNQTAPSFGGFGASQPTFGSGQKPAAPPSGSSFSSWR